ncbi:MAG: hypothetical protein ACM3VS_06225 [Candidatus Dadabacteria bacterium]
MKSYFIIALNVLFLQVIFSGCRKTSTVEPVSATWKRIDLVHDANIILNTVTDGRKLYCSGAYINSAIDTSNRISYVTSWTVSLNRMPRNSKYTVSFSEDNKTMYINSYKDSLLNYGTQVHVSNVDPQLVSYNAENLSPREIVAINDNGQVLVSGMDGPNHHNFYLITFNIHDAVFEYTPRSVVKLAIPAFVNPPTEIHSSNNDFFIVNYLNSTMYKIDPNGNVVATLSPLWGGEMFQYNNKLFLIHGSSILSSTDNGSSFSGNSYSADFNGYYFRSYGEKIFTFVPYSGVGLFEFTSTGFTIKPIMNKGLENTHITSVTFFNNKVFVSTLTGLYYLDWKDIIT